MSNGKPIPHTPLAVDFWHVRRCPESRIFFLSHMHSDHTVGLTSTWTDRPIYCSQVTASLLHVKLQVKEKWIRSLELGISHDLPLDDIGKENMTVTLIDANHCPGDFRYCPSMLRELCLTTNATIDVLYLDNTNCDPNRSIPSRKQATQQIKEILRSHPDHNAVLGLYGLGKESLLVELAMEFQTWIEVSFDRMETLQMLGLPDVFTTEPGAGRIRVVEQREITFTALCQWNSEQPTLAIYPTSRPLPLFHPKVFVVPYSDHSSYQELVDFVSGLKPSSLVPIVGSSIPGSLSTLSSSKRHEFLVPESVQQYMRRIPKNWHKSSTNLRRQHVRPLVPQGVVFDSPGSSSKLPKDCLGQSFSDEEEEEEEEMEAASVDSIPVKSSQKVTPYKARRDSLETLRVNFVHTAPEEMLGAHSVPFSQLSQSNFVPMEIVQNPDISLRPQRRAIGEVDEDHDNSLSVSDNDSLLLYSFHNDSGVSSDLLQCPEAHIEQLENEILKDLDFTEEDLSLCCLPKESAAGIVSLCPVRRP
ncbi:5' exonuclease Apollo isoform X2 [Syngnathoides biaculeatus]|uniref:5' exonuclease Apollo isoform X2 n=1 Tax=Syngnathoides biaculeatus TaxID=300417 RepID=UPI002ADD82DF|nr:5' exonuclease Apollo isoform X2 [Syngnathoides biaculeatus]